MLDTPCSEVVWRVLATHFIRQFLLHFPSHASPCAIKFQRNSTQSARGASVPLSWRHYDINIESSAPKRSPLEVVRVTSRWIQPTVDEVQPQCSTSFRCGHSSSSFHMTWPSISNAPPFLQLVFSGHHLQCGNYSAAFHVTINSVALLLYPLHPIITIIIIIMGTAVAQWLRCCATNRKVAGSIPAGISGFFIDTKSCRLHCGLGVDSPSNRNEYQEYFLGIKAAGA